MVGATKDKIFFLMIFLSIFAATVYVHFDEELSWDGATYLTNGEYFFGKVVLYDDLRPPVSSLLYGLLEKAGFSLLALKLVDAFVRSLAIGMVFVFFKNFVQSRNAFFGALALGLCAIAVQIPLFLTEYLSLIFAILFFTNLEKMRKSASALPIIGTFLFAMLAFLTRYAWIVLAMPLFFVLAEERGKHLRKNPGLVAAGIGIALLPLFFWGLYNHLQFGNALLSFKQGFKGVTENVSLQPWHHYFTNPWTNVFVLFNLSLIAFIAGFSSFWRKKSAPLLVGGVAYLLFIISTGHKLPRYLFPLAFFLIPVAIFFVESKYKRFAHSISFMLMALIIIPSQLIELPTEYGPKDVSFQEIGEALVKNTEPDAIIAAVHSPIIAYYSQRKTYSMTETTCEYLRCPKYPVSFRISYGCEEVDYVVSLDALNLSCLESFLSDDQSTARIYKVKKEK